MKRRPARLNRLNPRTAQDLAAVRQHVNVTEDKNVAQRCRVWHLSCGQAIDLVVNDIDLGAIAYALGTGLDIEAACRSLLAARP